MINPKALFHRCLLALALATTALGAAAAPINFHVRLDATSLSGAGYVDFLFAGSGGTALTATANHFVGSFGSGVNDYTFGDATIGADGTVRLMSTSGQDNIAGREATFGSFFDFDVAFNSSLISDSGINASSLIISLLESDGTTPAGTSDYGVVIFDLIPGRPIDIDVDPAFAAVAAVPEPSMLLMMVTGLGLVGFTMRRRKLPQA